MKTLGQLQKELKKELEDLTTDPLYGEMAELLHEAKHDIDEGFGEGEGECDCCDYYAFSEGDTPEGDL